MSLLCDTLYGVFPYVFQDNLFHLKNSIIIGLLEMQTKQFVAKNLKVTLTPQDKQGRKRPLDTPEKKIERRESETVMTETHSSFNSS